MNQTQACQRILNGLAISLTAFALIPATAHAATISKADNPDNLTGCKTASPTS